jgi:hypothetical protein
MRYATTAISEANHFHSVRFAGDFVIELHLPDAPFGLEAHTIETVFGFARLEHFTDRIDNSLEFSYLPGHAISLFDL